MQDAGRHLPLHRPELLDEGVHQSPSWSLIREGFQSPSGGLLSPHNLGLKASSTILSHSPHRKCWLPRWATPEAALSLSLGLKTPLGNHAPLSPAKAHHLLEENTAAGCKKPLSLLKDRLTAFIKKSMQIKSFTGIPLFSEKAKIGEADIVVALAKPQETAMLSARGSAPMMPGSPCDPASSLGEIALTDNTDDSKHLHHTLRAPGPKPST